MCSDVISGTVINGLFTIIAIIVSFLIANWYHKKKPRSDIHFNERKQRLLEDLIHRTGMSFSNFKQECKHVIDKSKIYEHDLVAFGMKDYDQLIGILEGNQKYVTERHLQYLQYVNADEYYHHVDFFNTMLSFVRGLQIKKRTDLWNEDDEIEYMLDRLNKELKIIKSQENEYDGISHIIRATSTLSRKGSLGIRGIRNYKSPSPIN